MAKTMTDSIVADAQRLANGDDAWKTPLIPIHQPSIFECIVTATADALADTDDDDMLLIADGHSVGTVATLGQLREKSRTIAVVGTPPDDWKDAAAISVPWKSDEHKQPFVFILSSRVSVAIIAPRGDNALAGGWTCDRDQVIHLITAVLASAKEKPSFPNGHDDASSIMAAASTRIMASHAEAMAVANQSESLNHDDLLAILEILKSISARRRSHDILYVFVEKIARIIPMDRCSVVRVWGGDQKRAHVLASHEDARVHDIVIDLERYPEINQALETRDKVTIDDVRDDPLTKEFASEFTQANIRSLLVVPVVLFDQDMGSLILRAARSEDPFSTREINFCEILAEAAANALERAHLVDTIQKANQRLEYLATTDGLTGLFNHRYFTQHLENEFIRAVRYNLPLSCIMFDLDDFKNVNDAFGHLSGDAVLRQVAGRLREAARQNDIVARYGGEEFAMILPQTGHDGAVTKAEQVLDMLRSEPYEGLPPDLTVTTSVGVGVLDRDAMSSYQYLLRATDEALYEAKRSGKNRVVLAPTEDVQP
jgi:diguanylate cyclase (GGDEF)-like protein